ncbi:hypothetical protein [Thomasclavelia saccharogumia]|nr:hypothetical protein [Thomasclavelia saccharogumia]
MIFKSYDRSIGYQTIKWGNEQYLYLLCYSKVRKAAKRNDASVYYMNKLW